MTKSLGQQRSHIHLEPGNIGVKLCARVHVGPLESCLRTGSASDDLYSSQSIDAGSPLSRGVTSTLMGIHDAKSIFFEMELAQSPGIFRCHLLRIIIVLTSIKL